jgi:hypothetical protein
MKQPKIIIAIILLLVFVAGAAFMAARMWAAAGLAEEAGPGDGKMLQFVSKGGGGPQMISLEIEPAPELPRRPAEARGIFVRREDDNIFVGTGEIEVRLEVDEASGQPSTTTSHQGPVVEVVVNRETQIYQDVTSLGFEPGAAPEGGTHKIQQKVQLADSLEDLGKDNEIQVWGERRGDRVVAEIFVFRAPLLWTGKN